MREPTAVAWQFKDEIITLDDGQGLPAMYVLMRRCEKQPLVSIERTEPGVRIFYTGKCIDIDVFQIGYEAVAHLLEFFDCLA